ncbi:MAG: IclR family transcriptional regulator [Candidatus Korobacteraceae bacterium]
MKRVAMPKPGERAKTGKGTKSSPYRIQVLDRALAILDELGNLSGDASLAEIVGAVKVHKSTVHRLLMSLEKHRLVDRDSRTGRYRLGMRLFQLGTLAVAHINIRHLARPFLQNLMYNSDETVHLCVLDNGEMLYLDKVEPNRSVRMSSTIGRRNPAHCTAVGKAVLACLPESEVDAIIRQHGMRRFTPNTLTTPVDLKTELKLIRERGYAIDDEENEDGVRCVAAVVMDYAGRPAAAISVSSPSFRLPLEKAPSIAQLVCETAHALSRECGYHPARSPEVDPAPVHTALREPN